MSARLPPPGAGLRFEAFARPVLVRSGDAVGYCDGWYVDLAGRRIHARVWLAPSLRDPGRFELLEEPSEPARERAA